jgi:hypothetical protein
MDVQQDVRRENDMGQEIDRYRIIARCSDERYISYSNRGLSY